MQEKNLCFFLSSFCVFKTHKIAGKKHAQFYSFFSNSLKSSSVERRQDAKFRNPVFTNSALWAGSVIELPCPYVCMCVCMSVIIVNNGQSIRFFVFLYQIEWGGMVLRILNLEAHEKCIMGSKVTTILTKFFVHV